MSKRAKSKSAAPATGRRVQRFVYCGRRFYPSAGGVQEDEASELEKLTKGQGLEMPLMPFLRSYTLLSRRHKRAIRVSLLELLERW